MKGRKLTVEEVLKMDGQKVYVECTNDEKENGCYTIKNTNYGGIVIIDLMKEGETNPSFELNSPFSKTCKFYEYLEEPRTYKTSEMIAMLEENEELRFIANKGEDGEASCYVMNDEIVVVGEEPVLYLSDTWTLIDENKRNVSTRKILEGKWYIL